MTPELPRLYTHWANHKEKRIFLIVDLPNGFFTNVVMIEVKSEAPDAERNVIQLSPTDWMLIAQVEKKLKPYIPSL